MTISGASGVYSNAYNFLSFVSTGVDPRTGTYSCNFSLSNLLANTLSGPSIPLVLGFSSLQSDDLGFGKGWGLQLSNFNRKTGKLSLSNGASHMATLGTSSFVLKDKKVKDLKTSRSGRDLLIEHKSGILEVLSSPSSSADQWLVSKIYSSEGRVIYLDYGWAAGRSNLLAVRDESRRLLTVDRSRNLTQVHSITLWPDSPGDKIVFDLQAHGGQLTSMSSLAANRSLGSWRFQYRTVTGLNVITRLDQPTGGTEEITYQASGMLLPSSAPLKALPAVSSHTHDPRNGQPAVVREFKYSSKNYLGYASSVKWRDDGDNLYDARGDYQYSSTEDLIQGKGTNKRVIRRTQRVYNRFHLQLEETVTQNGKTVRNITKYHDRTNVRFDNQPANFQLPSEFEMSWSDTSIRNGGRSEVTLTEYDDCGNVRKKVSPTGIVEIFEYYPVGTSDGCPADAFGEQRWLKSKTLMPAPGFAPAPTMVTHYRYTDLPSASPDRARFLVLAQESVTEDGQSEPLMTIAHHYNDDPASKFFGRIKQKVETVAGFATTFDYFYELKDGALCTHITLTAQDGCSSSKSIWQNMLTGAETKTVEQLGVVVETAHDRLGRKTLETIAPKTSGQAARSYSYKLAEILSDPVETRSVAANGATTVTRLDGMSRECAIAVQDIDAVGQPMRDVYLANYDALGQLVEEIHTDWLDDEPYAMSTRYSYDDWGNRSASTGPDGVLNHDLYDPITLTQTQGLDKAGKTVFTKNVFGKNDSVERFDSNGVSRGVTEYLYDGLGRCVQQINPHGHTTRFAYDFADRLVMTHLPDGTRIKKAFVAHSTENLATHIWVNEYLAGERTYDGLLRVTSVTVGGRTETFSYEGAQPNPVTRTTAGGKVISYTYDPVLSNQMTQRSVASNSELSASFRYDSSHAKLIEASSPDHQQQLNYSLSGQHIGDQLGDQGLLRAGQRHSLNGLPLQYTDASGQEQITRYDAVCRIAKVEQGSVDASYFYDSFGRISKIEAVDSHSERKLTTQLEYDDFGREILRKLTVDSNESEELNQQFDASDRLIRRTLKQGNGVLRDETFVYDSRGRLEQYQCSGKHLPVDPAGKAIQSQTYVFDELDNVLKMTTRFAGGENIATFEYGYLDRTQLSRVTHSHPDYASQQATFTYDSDGNQLNDECGRRMIYDDLGRLASVAQEHA